MKVSDKQKNYLKKIKRNKIFIRFTQIFILISLLLVWELLAKYEIINSFITSSPSKILRSISSLFINI